MAKINAKKNKAREQGNNSIEKILHVGGKTKQNIYWQQERIIHTKG